MTNLSLQYSAREALGRYNNMNRTKVTLFLASLVILAGACNSTQRSSGNSPAPSKSWSAIKASEADSSLIAKVRAAGYRVIDRDSAFFASPLPEGYIEIENTDTYYSEFCMAAFRGDSLALAGKYNTLPIQVLDLISNPELLAINADALGVEAKEVLKVDGGYVYTRDIEYNDGKTKAVALYNPSDSACEFEIDYATLGLGGDVKVRDVNYRLDFADSPNIHFVVQAKDVKILKLTATKKLRQS